MQFPRATNETTLPLSVQIPALDGSRLKTTARPELEVAVTVYGGSALSTCGAVEVKVIVCEPLPTANDCWTVVAARYVPLPAWFALMRHVPTPIIDTVDPEMLQTE